MRQKWPYNTILSQYSSIRYVLNNVQIKRCLGNKGECFKWQSYHTRHYLHSKIHFHNICVMFSLCASIEFGVTKNISCVLLTLPNKALPLIYKATLHLKWSWYFLEHTLHCSVCYMTTLINKTLALFSSATFYLNLAFLRIYLVLLSIESISCMAALPHKTLPFFSKHHFIWIW